MSLLIKALEQAAKDRTTPRIQPRSPSPIRKSPDHAREPTLEAVPSSRSVVSHSGAQGGTASSAREGVAHVLASLRGNPIMMLAAVAALCGIGFGIYVYLQIAATGHAHQAEHAASAADDTAAASGHPARRGRSTRNGANKFGCAGNQCSACDTIDAG